MQQRCAGCRATCTLAAALALGKLRQWRAYRVVDPLKLFRDAPGREAKPWAAA